MPTSPAASGRGCSRRDFLVLGALAAGGLVLLDPMRPLSRALAAAAPSFPPAARRRAAAGGLRPVDHMTLSVFQQMRGDTVQLQSPSGERFSARVAHVDDLSQGRGAYHQFSVMFHTDLRQALPQGNYTVTHAREGSCVLFLVPVISHGPGVTYQAVFTRPV